jgi:hypothetical protein
VIRADVGLNESAQVTLNGAGYGVARLGPGRAGTRWLVTTVAVSVAGTVVNVPQIRLYKGAPSPGQEITNSYNGARNSSDGMSVTLHAGEYLSAEWSAGDPAAVATISVFGTRSG